jgi:hypothetical protein
VGCIVFEKINIEKKKSKMFYSEYLEKYALHGSATKTKIVGRNGAKIGGPIVFLN